MTGPIVNPSVYSDSGRTATSLPTLNCCITKGMAGTYVEVPTVLNQVSNRLEIHGRDNLHDKAVQSRNSGMKDFLPDCPILRIPSIVS